MDKRMRGKMSLRRRTLIDACAGNRAQVRAVERALGRKAAARRRARVAERNRRALYRELGWDE